MQACGRLSGGGRRSRWRAAATTRAAAVRRAPTRARPRARRRRPTLDASKGAKGTITMCAGKDTSGALTEAIELFNKQHAADGVKVKILELAADATAVRDQFIQRAQAKSGRLRRAAGRHHLDRRVRPAEVAAWTSPTTRPPRKGEFIPSTLASYDYDGKLWGLPQVTGAGLLYRRSDQVRRRPRHVAGALRAGRRERRLRLPGRSLRGPDLQLRRAVLRRRRADPLRGRQEGRVRLARRT